MFIYVHDIWPYWMTTRWKLEKMYTRLRASEPIFWFKSALKTYDSSQISIIYIVDKSLFCRYNMSMAGFVTLVIWSCSLYWLENKKLEKNDIERAERASQNFCSFASEKCFTYRPETREKAIINYCEQANFVCVWNMRFFSIFCWWIT